MASTCCSRAGEVRGLLGPNGAGKTTLLEILFGLIRADGGRVELFGHELDGLGDDRVARRRRVRRGASVLSLPLGAGEPGLGGAARR